MSLEKRKFPSVDKRSSKVVRQLNGKYNINQDALSVKHTEFKSHSNDVIGSKNGNVMILSAIWRRGHRENDTMVD